MTDLEKINAALHALIEAGCRRDPASGSWLTRDGLALGSDPVAAAKALRLEAIRAAVRKNQSEGRCFTR